MRPPIFLSIKSSNKFKLRLQTRRPTPSSSHLFLHKMRLLPVSYKHPHLVVYHYNRYYCTHYIVIRSLQFRHHCKHAMMANKLAKFKTFRLGNRGIYANDSSAPTADPHSKVFWANCLCVRSALMVRVETLQYLLQQLPHSARKASLAGFLKMQSNS